MAEKAYYVTEEGLAALQAELEDLKVNRRKEVAEKIKEALSFGDLSENSEYDEAKNDQAILEARIADLEVMVSNARVIEKENLAADTVHIGSSVFVKTKRADGSEAERSSALWALTKQTRARARSPMNPPWAKHLSARRSDRPLKWRHPQASWSTRSSPYLN